MNALTAKWSALQALPSRTRWVLAISGLTLIIGLGWAYIWQPVADGRHALVTRIPALETSLATMRADAEEIKRLNAMPAVVTTNTPRAQADVAALQGLFGTNAKISVNENRAFIVSLPTGAYQTLIDRLDQLLSRYRLKVVSMSLKSADGSNNVSAELTLTDDGSKSR